MSDLKLKCTKFDFRLQRSPYPLAVLYKPTSKGREGKGRWRGREGEGRGEEGREGLPPPLIGKSGCTNGWRVGLVVSNVNEATR